MKSVTQRIGNASRRLVRDKVRQAFQPGQVMPLLEQEIMSIVTDALNQELLKEQEMTIGRKPYERSDNPTYRNGFKDAFVPSCFGGFLRLRRPVNRRGGSNSHLYRALKAAGSALIAFLGVKSWTHGLSTRAAASDLNATFGTRLSHSDISALSDHLLPSLEAWRSKPLPSDIAYLYLDAAYLPVVSNSRTSKQALLLALGLDPRGRRHLLGFLLGDRESTDSWTALLDELLARGLDRSKLKLVVSDEHKGIENAVETRLGVPHQLCVVHLLRNNRHRIPQRDQAAFLADFKAIFWAESREASLLARGRFEQRWLAAYPRVVGNILARAERFLLFHDQPKQLWTVLRSSNLIERFIQELRRRLRPAGTIQSENELLKLVWAVTVKQQESWERIRARGFKQLNGKEGATTQAA